MMTFFKMTIRAKLLVMLLIANTALIMMIYIANQVAFEKSFSEYVHSSAREKVKPVIEYITKTMNEEGDYLWLDRRSHHWHTIMGIYHQREQLAEQEKEYKPRSKQRAKPKGPKKGPKGQGDRLFFKTPAGELLIGRPKAVKQALWLEVYSKESELIGYLGLENGSLVTGKFEQLFAKQQQQYFAYIALLAFAITFLLSIPFSKYLVKPVVALRKRAKQLTSGDFSVSEVSDRKDELGLLANDLNTLANTLAENLTARQRWIADISHELRTPLAIVQAELEGMIDGVIETDESQLHSLQDEVKRLTKLVNDLHQLSLSDRGALSYEKAKYNVTDIIERCLDKQKQKLRHFNIEFDDAPIYMLFCDSMRMEQLFDNLLQNTLRYTDASESESGQLRVQVTKHRKGLTVSWQDSSPSVSEEQLPYLFDRLYRVDEARQRVSGGSGLGLAICENIIKAHNAEVLAKQSELGGLALIMNFYNKER